MRCRSTRRRFRLTFVLGPVSASGLNVLHLGSSTPTPYQHQPCCDNPTAPNAPWSRRAATVKGWLSGLKCCFCESGSLSCNPKPGKHECHLRKPIPTIGGEGLTEPARPNIHPRAGHTNVGSKGGDRPRVPRWETAKPRSATCSSAVPYGPPPARTTLPGNSRSHTASLCPKERSL